jgi:hypothetical protein
LANRVPPFLFVLVPVIFFLIFCHQRKPRVELPLQMLSQIGDLVQVIGQALEVSPEEAFNLPGSRELLYLSGRASLALPLALASGPIVIYQRTR